MKLLVVSLATVLAAVSGCSFDDQGVTVRDAAVDPDVPEVPDAAPDASPPDAGEPDAAGCVATCTDETHLDTCTPDDPIECPLGCKVIEDDADRCAVIVPSNGASVTMLAGATASLVVPAGATYVFDTETGGITSGGAVIRSGGNDVIAGIGFFRAGEQRVFAVRSLQVAATGTLTAVGENPLLLLSAGDVVVHGTIDVSAVCREDDGSVGDDFSCGGAGGGVGSRIGGIAGGCAAGEDGTSASGIGPETGGGGGGFKENGAPGGSSGLTSGGDGGMAGSCVDATLEPLSGGSGGGQGGGESMLFGGPGGGGGGAVQITSLTSITIENVLNEVGSILASGGGGAGGGASFGGGGGGSGGAILLEAPHIVLTKATLAANGGGGGQGNGVQPGENGQPSGMRARGGGGAGNGHGGDGGSAAGPPTAGVADDFGTLDGTGGGGGASGRIRLNVKELSNSGGSVVSPAASTALPDAS